MGERLRELLKDPQLTVAPETEALMFAAARAELVAQVIRPALEQGKVVVSDRFLDSSLAYQGIARGLGVEDVEQINRFATAGLLPDLTFLLSIDPSRAAQRAGQLDRFEDEGDALQRAVFDAYRDRYHESIRMLNGMERTLEQHLPPDQRRFPDRDSTEP